MKTERAAKSGFEVCRLAADAYLNSGRLLDICARELYDSLVEASGYSGDDIKYYNPQRYTSGPIIVDVRTSDSEMPDLYYAGHIPGAWHVSWQEIARPKTLECLPKGRRIVVYSGNGQTGGQAAAVLGLLGYDAVNLKWGISAWTRDADAAPGRYEKVRDTVWQEGSAYRTVTGDNSIFRVHSPAVTEAIYPFPSVTGDFDDEMAGMAALADAYLSSCRAPNLAPPELYRRLYFDVDSAVSGQSSEKGHPLETAPLLLDVREQEAYRRGFIPGSLHTAWNDVFKERSLSRLPPDSQIVVYSSTGHKGAQVTALLNLLGYRAANLKWGIAGWSLALPGAEIAPGRYVEAKDCLDYRIVSGFDAFVKCTT